MPAQDIVGGTDGAVDAAGFNGEIDSWSANTAVTEATWRTFASKVQQRANVTYAFTGQFSGTIQFDDTDTAPQPDPSGASAFDAYENIDLTLTATTGCTYIGKANITGANLSRPATDRMTGTWNFAFTEAPTQTWAETSA